MRHVTCGNRYTTPSSGLSSVEANDLSLIDSMGRASVADIGFGALG